MIILDLSANTHKNDKDYYKKIVKDINKYHPEDLVIKNQLFLGSGDNVVQDRNLFLDMAKWTYNTFGYKTTASVFDDDSLGYLQNIKLPYSLPFIKIANNKKAYKLIRKIKGQAIVSVSDIKLKVPKDTIFLCCVSEYPATVKSYVNMFTEKYLKNGISDHTEGLELYYKYKPKYWEKHIKLKDSTGLDSGKFAITPDKLKKL